MHVGFILCDKCRRRVFFGSKTPVVEESPSSSEQRQPIGSQTSTETPSSQSSGSVFEIVVKEPAEQIPVLELSLHRTFISHLKCCFCRNKNNLIRVPLNGRLQCFNKRRIFIPIGNRVCSEHLIKKRFFDDDLQLIEVYSNTSFLTAEEICLFLNKISDSASQTFLDKIKSAELTEKQLFSFTGLSNDQLQDLKELLVSMRSSHSRNVTQALVIFLFKLRTGSSNDFISSVFGIDNPIKVSDFCESVINSFEKNVLPKFFGIKSIAREELISNHTPIYAKRLFKLTDDTLALVFDGTYLRHQKSNNNAYQRKSYSGQKKCPLVKPFTICTTDGYVVDVPGPYLATENDGKYHAKSHERSKLSKIYNERR